MELNARKSWWSTALAHPMRALRRSTYNPRLLAVARFLHLSNRLRRSYQCLTGRNDKVLEVRAGKIDVLFISRSALEYRWLESFFVGFESDFLDVLSSSLREGDVFLDVGSSVGHFTVPMAKLVGTSGMAIAVEPEAGASAQLEANLGLNGFSNVRILKMALGDERAEAALSWERGSCPSLLRGSTQHPEPVSTSARDGASGLQFVRVEVGDQVMARERLPIPQAVKIDVEGYELQVIRGLSRTLGNAGCRLLCCEIHPSFLPVGATPQQVVDAVKLLGFADVALKHRLGEIHMVARKTQS